ncbi:MAG: DUF1559 domain-containing protein [Planctomycetia bacterium]|jgi:prepilin-type processing-associated H-X9-DG protein
MTSCYRNTKARTESRGGVTLLDLLVTFVIICVLVAMLLPAIQASREADRNLKCKNHVKQLSFAAIQVLRTHGGFPSAGWGNGWMPDATLGIGPNQPGGWGYQVLPYINQNELFELGSKATTTAEKRAANVKRATTPLAIWNCPARRPAKLYPIPEDSSWPFVKEPFLCNALTESIRTDYTMNAGDFLAYKGFDSVWYADDPQKNLAGYMKRVKRLRHELLTGVTWRGSKATAKDISDGMSNTYLIGEKAISLDYMGKSDKQEWGDDQNPYSADERDSVRWADPDLCPRPMIDTAGINGEEFSWAFGSPHPEGFNMSFCDGSVRSISYKIDLQMHADLANRHDGHKTDSSSW